MNEPGGINSSNQSLDRARFQQDGASTASGDSTLTRLPDHIQDRILPTKTFEPLAPRARDLYPVAIQPGAVARAEDAAVVLSTLLGRPEFADQINGIAAKLGPERARFEESLASFALIADSALTMIDYQTSRTGWRGFGRFPETRGGYRTRSYRPEDDAASQPRRDRSKVEIAAALEHALLQADPVAATESKMIESFLAQLGISEETSADWKPNAAAISKALADELFIPMRAVLDGTLHLDHENVSRQSLGDYRPEELDKMCRGVAEEIAKHVAEGDFDQWRDNTPQGKLQLECLSDDQYRALRAPTSIEKTARSGRKLVTRDAVGADLFWVTKIGGPSHAFDLLTQCHLALLANARNGAIIVDEEGYGDAARSTVRVLPQLDGPPVLYLEMKQIDFPHDMRSPVYSAELRSAIIEHAAAKARAMGIKLVMAPSMEQAEMYAEELGLGYDRKNVAFVLHPSAGVFEASDTLVGSHHAVQVEEKIASPYARVLVIDP